MQNKPNLKKPATKKMQNEPNFPNTQRRKNEKRTQFRPQRTKDTHKRCIFYTQKVSLSRQIFNTFSNFRSESAHFSSFFQLLDTKVLNSMYNKDLHKHFTPKHPSTTNVEAKRRSAAGGQNKPKAYVLKSTKTNPICQERGISIVTEKTYVNSIINYT